MRKLTLLILILFCGCVLTHKPKSLAKLDKPKSVNISDGGSDSTAASTYTESEHSGPVNGGYDAEKADEKANAKCGYDKDGNWGIIGQDGLVIKDGLSQKGNPQPPHRTRAQPAPAMSPPPPPAMDTITIINPDAPELGVITYYVPDTMMVGKEYYINLRIARYLSAAVTEGLPAGSVTKPIRVGASMKAVIKETDPAQDAFKIDTLSTGTQTIEKDSSYTTWEWTVMPLRSGKHGIKLTVVIKQQGLTKDIPVYEDNIIVQSSWGYSIKTFCLSNWKIFATGLAFPLILLLFKRREKKEEEIVHKLVDDDDEA